MRRDLVSEAAAVRYLATEGAHVAGEHLSVGGGVGGATAGASAGASARGRRRGGRDVVVM